MVAANIKINGSAGSNTDLPAGTLVTLSNADNTGVTTWLWTILDQPPGTADNLSSPSAAAPTFTPNKEGSYLIQLIVNQGTGTEQRSQVIAAVLQSRTLERQPAAGETTETGADGWAGAANAWWRRLDQASVDSNVILAQANGALSANDIVVLDLLASELTGLPGEYLIAKAAPYLADGGTGNAKLSTQTLGIVVGARDGSGSVADGEIAVVRIRGVHVISTGIVPIVPAGSPVYVDQTGQLVKRPVTESDVGPEYRRIGYLLNAGKTMWFDGTPLPPLRLDYRFQDALPTATFLAAGFVTRPCIFPENGLGSWFQCLDAPSSNLTLLLFRNNEGGAFATVIIDTSGALSSITNSSGPKLFAAGDYVTIKTPLGTTYSAARLIASMMFE